MHGIKKSHFNDPKRWRRRAEKCGGLLFDMPFAGAGELTASSSLECGLPSMSVFELQLEPTKTGGLRGEVDGPS
jgi:hypothetical protein